MATFDSLFANLRELPDKTPRRELLPGLRRPPVPGAMLLWLLIFGVALTIFFAVMVATLEAQKKPFAGKSRAQVLLRERLTTYGSNSVPSIFLKYRFQAKGREVIAAYIIDSRDPLFNMPKGGTFGVVYNTADPNEHKSALASPQSPDELPMFVWVVMPFFIVFWFGIMFMPILGPRLKSWWLARRLFKQGYLAQGQILFVNEGLTNAHSLGNAFRVVYAFTDASGVTHESVQGVNNSWLVGQWKPESPVVVAYDVKKPRQSVILDGFSAAHR